MRIFSFTALIVLMFISCSRNETSQSLSIGYEGVDSMKTIISLKEKKLKEYYNELMNGTINIDTLPHNLINNMVKDYQVYYHLYPKDSMTPYYLDKIHQLFTQEKQYTYAVDWVDTLLYHYPNYKNKTQVLYSAATSSDLYLMDTNRVKKYYSRMLNECPKLKTSIKLQILSRLKFLSIPYVDYIEGKRN